MLTFPSVAHEQALKICRIMHCDVSAGNILIIFSIVRPSSEEAYSIVMKGLLSDWELAKVIPETNSAVFASQPERTPVSACDRNTFNED